MRIALLCDEYPPRPHGGIGTFTRTYARGLTSAGHDVTVIELADTDVERFDGDVRVLGVARSRVRGVAWWRDRVRLAAAVASGGFDVVETPDYDGLLPRGAGTTPVALRIHGSRTACAAVGAQPAGHRIRWCERETARHAAACIHPSEHALSRARQALGAPARNAPSTLVPHPTPPVPDAPVSEIDPPPGRRVLFAGSLWGHRGVSAAARAAALVLDARPDVHFVFVGEDGLVDGRRASLVIRDAIGHRHARRVHMTGRVPHAVVAAWMRASDVFLYPSAEEAFGLVLLEAMRERLPVVGSSRGPGAEIVKHDVTGLLAAPDDPRALAAAVTRLLDDRALHERLVRAALTELSARFSVEACVEGSVAVYERALQDR